MSSPPALPARPSILGVEMWRPQTPGVAHLHRVQPPQCHGGILHDIQFWGRGRVVGMSLRQDAGGHSSCAVQSLGHNGPATGNTTIRVGWKRRPRGSRAPDETAVVVDRVLPLEAAIRGFAGRGTEVVVNTALGTIFDSLAEAYEFYNLYSWEVRFGIRYGKSRQNVNCTKCMQEIVCGCAGKPERENSCDM
ncbi:uncharacterized protein LOC119327547 [Triticum dicoccoides]|uniref:uncharacterized protein LOC119327547 n=1 Tax=Triticum dicoccoides TaxID=85692 RepID=UPI0008440BD0|nr:uncharacterized protein LOC119327547 [Triticum dicoccoides]XP_044424532.1 uncharacterized protein LOC123149061 [Triticum aestivum]